MRERTRWHDDEWEAIVRLATPKLLENPKLSVIDAVRVIQNEAITREDRRRALPNVGAIRPDIRMRLEQLRSPDSAKTVPIEAHKELEVRYAEANSKIKALLEQNASLQATIQSLNMNRPKEPMAVIKEFMADILALAMAKQSSIESPPQIKAEEPVAPKIKHDPEPKPENGIRKPKLAIVGGSTERHQELHREFGNDLELRLFHGSDERGRIGDQLRAYKDRSHGKIIVWTDYCGHSVEAALRFQNIPFEKFRGQFSQLKTRIRTFIRGGGPA